jgi:hypothetical protein
MKKFGPQVSTNGHTLRTKVGCTSKWPSLNAVLLVTDM